MLAWYFTNMYKIVLLYIFQKIKLLSKNSNQNLPNPKITQKVTASRISIDYLDVCSTSIQTYRKKNEKILRKIRTMNNFLKCPIMTVYNALMTARLGSYHLAAAVICSDAKFSKKIHFRSTPLKYL